MSGGDGVREDCSCSTKQGIKENIKYRDDLMWNQKFPTEVYEHDPYERFSYGVAPALLHTGLTALL